MKYIFISITGIAAITFISIAAVGTEETVQKETIEVVEHEKPGKRFRTIVLDSNYNHDKWGVSPTDISYNLAAYSLSFDSNDDDNGDGKSDLWGVPEWVAFEIKANSDPLPKYNRPSTWLTDDALYKKREAPNDATYAVSGTSKMKVVSTNSRFVRGHMCPKNAADRLGEDAGYNTHTVLNAVPQLQSQNNGIWKTLEQDCTDWADKYGQVWVVTGPAFFGKNPAMWLGQEGEVRAAIPDATYKIVIRENPNSESGIEVMAFLFPNVLDSKYKTVSDFLTSVEDIENVTGLTFLTTLSADKKELEFAKNEKLSNEEKAAVFAQW